MVTSDDLAFFAVLAESRSLAQAARRLNVTPPAVSQRLRALESRVGVRLVDRTTRQLSLTDEGALVASHGILVADALAALSEALGNRTQKVSGHLRVAASHGFGRIHVAPVAELFARLHGEARITLELSDHPGAQLVESHDLVIHIGPAGPLNQVVTTLAPNRRFLCASPQYLDEADPIAEPADLASHRCLVVRENEEDVTLWRFHRPGHQPRTVRIHPVMSSNDGAVIREWTLRGHGITVRSEWDVAEDLRARQLRRVLPEWEVPSADVVAMLGSRHGRSARARVFLSMLRASLNPPPWRRTA
jgi:DNA-binding transcriptional LysR family regulator